MVPQPQNLQQLPQTQQKWKIIFISTPVVKNDWRENSAASISYKRNTAQAVTACSSSVSLRG
jgi:hypothetical protein